MLKFLSVLLFIGSLIGASVWGISQVFELTEFFSVFGIVSFSSIIALVVMYSVNKTQDKWRTWRTRRAEAKAE